jgi:DNA-binding transcriptional regulator YiaG
MEARLRALRLTNNLTIREFAEIIDVSVDIVRLWERGKRYPSHKNGKKLVHYFKAQSLEWLMQSTNSDESA